MKLKIGDKVKFIKRHYNLDYSFDPWTIYRIEKHGDITSYHSKDNNYIASVYKDDLSTADIEKLN